MTEVNSSWALLFFFFNYYLYFFVHSEVIFAHSVSFLQVCISPECEGSGLQSTAAVPSESEEPRNGRLPPSEAQARVGMAQLSSVSSKLYIHDMKNVAFPLSTTREADVHDYVSLSPGTSTAWRPSVTMTCWTPPQDRRWRRDTRPAFVWRTHHVTREYADALPALFTHRLFFLHPSIVRQ